MGHGSGDKRIDQGIFNQLQNLQNLCILMGCASVRLTFFENLKMIKNQFQGIAIDYLSSDV